jgi:hypothetical protein
VALLQSFFRAASGLLKDLEDTALLVYGIGPDIVSDMATSEYYGDLILPYLESQEIAAGTRLVRTLKKDGTKYVANKDLAAKYGKDKNAIVRITLNDPKLLSSYRKRKSSFSLGSLTNAALSASVGADLPDFDKLLDAVTRVAPGKPGADEYHKASSDYYLHSSPILLLSPTSNTRYMTAGSA